MKRNTGPARLDELSPQARFAILAAFVGLVALMGGGSRSDIASIPMLRGIAVMVAFAMVALTPAAAWRGIRVPLILLGLLALWMMVQLVPLPSGLWSGLPMRDRVFAIDQLLGAADRARPISLTPSATVNSLLSLSVPLAALLAAAALPAGARVRLWWLIWAFALGSAIVALLQFMAGPRSLFYFYRITNEGSLVGLFANRNHHALLLALGILASGWLIIVEVMRKPQRPLVIAGLSISIMLFLLLILAIGSRQGLICGIAGVLLIYPLIRWSYRFAPKPINQVQRRAARARSGAGWTRGLLLNAVPVVLVTGLAIFFYLSSRSNAVQRLIDGHGVEEIRLAALGTVTDLVKAQWLLGSGFGSFAQLYQIVEPDAMLREDYFNQAHNDWLQMPIEGGLPAVLILLAVIGWILAALWGMWRQRKSRAADPAIAELIILAACFAFMAFCSVVDFPLRTPSLAGVASLLLVVLVRRREEVAGMS